MKRKFVYSDILYNKRRKIMMYNEEYSNELSNEDFVSLVQNINNCHHTCAIPVIRASLTLSDTLK